MNYPEVVEKPKKEETDVKINRWWDKTFYWEKAKKYSKNIISIPYNVKESINWVLKHINIYGGIPIIILFITLPFTLIDFLPMWAYISMLVAIFLILFWLTNFISRRIYKKKYDIPNIGIGSLIWVKKKVSDEKKPWFKIPLNELTGSKKYSIGFIGDIMKMNKYELSFGDKLKDFFKETDLIVGNLEGLISDKKEGLASQNHNEEIIEQLLRLIKGNKKTKWLLCMSNNHSGDFGYEIFKKTQDRLEEKDEIEVFGPREKPYFPYEGYKFQEDDDLLKKIRIVSGTMWVNHKKTVNYISLYEWKNDYFGKDKFNILFPHWHYENEDYVRDSMNVKGKDLLIFGDDCCEEKPWDLIFGHHPHVPQAITRVSEKNTPNKLLAYSGGNFTSGVWRDKHNHGLILKCDIGPWKEDNKQLAAANLEWSYTINDFNKWKLWKKEKTVKIDLPQNKKKIFFIIRKQMVHSVYIGFIFIPIILTILFLLGFEINLIRLYSNLALIEIAYISFIILDRNLRRKRIIKKTDSLKKKKELRSYS
ncbi:MAG: CapA family protein [Candidatus Hodarchaeota archaeon]